MPGSVEGDFLNRGIRQRNAVTTHLLLKASQQAKYLCQPNGKCEIRLPFSALIHRVARKTTTTDVPESHSHVVGSSVKPRPDHLVAQHAA